MVKRLLQGKTLCERFSDETIENRDMNSHQNVCPYQSIACLAADVDCDWIGRRKDVIEHEKLCQFIPIRIPLLKVSQLQSSVIFVRLLI